jgi:hypothetical protein
MSGGHGMLHEFSLVLRVVQKSLTESDKTKFGGKSKQMDSAARFAFMVKKQKVQVMARSGEFVRLLEGVQEMGLEKGAVDDHTLALNTAKEYDLLEKKENYWHIAGFKAKRQADLVSYWRKDSSAYHKVQQKIIAAAKAAREEGRA